MFQNRLRSFLKGTLILTVTGLVSRMIGFFYRIFLSRTIGATGVGIYQQISSVYLFGFALTSAGIVSAISRFVAKSLATGKKRDAGRYFLCGTLLSLFLAVLLSCVVFLFRNQIAIAFFDNAECAPFLGVLSVTFPLCALHCSINGWYYGCNKTEVPSLCQLIEQVIRVLFVYLCYVSAARAGNGLTVSAAVYGLVAGEAAATLFSLAAMLVFVSHALPLSPERSVLPLRKVTADMLSLSIPLTVNRVVIHLFSIAEAVYIPQTLTVYGLTNEDALAVYGVLEGMALPMILFPSVLTNSAAVLLLPEVAGAQASDNTARIRRVTLKASKASLLLGAASTVFFLIFGKWIGRVVFQSELAGSFLLILAWICPFLYLSSTLSSILNGLGDTTANFLYHLLSCAVRFAFVLVAIPCLGMRGYLYGMLVSELLLTAVMARRLLFSDFLKPDTEIEAP
jgi:stage V sporulation protein B